MKVLETEIKIIEELSGMAKSIVFSKKELAKSISRQLGVEISANEFGRWLQIMDETKPNQKPTFRISEDFVYEITKRRFTPQEFEDYLKKALSGYVRQLQKERDRDAR